MRREIYKDLLNQMSIEEFEKLDNNSKSKVLYEIANSQNHGTYYSKERGFNLDQIGIHSKSYLLQIDDNRDGEYLAVIKGNGKYVYVYEDEFLDLLKNNF